MQAKANFIRNKNVGLEYSSIITRGGVEMRAKSYRQGQSLKTVFEDGTYMLKTETDNDEGKTIRIYDSKTNRLHVQKIAAATKIEEVYIDEESNYPLYIREGETEEYVMSCDKYIKEDVNETLKVCVNEATGIIPYREKMNAYQEVITSFVIGKVDENVFTFPEDAEIFEN
ncbi:MAG: hypothetical protein ACK5N8_01695 [Alphaproteobacteria bacterium]